MGDGTTAAAAAVTVEVRVEELTLDTVVGEHRVYVHGGVDYDGYWETQPMTVLDMVVDRLVTSTLRDKAARGAIERMRDEVVKAAVANVVAEVMAEPFTPTTAYGEKAGEPMTLRGVIVEQAQKALTIRSDRGSYGNKETIAEAVIRTTVDAAFVKELRAVVDAEKARVLDLMKAEGARVIAAMLAAAVK